VKATWNYGFASFKGDMSIAMRGGKGPFGRPRRKSSSSYVFTNLDLSGLFRPLVEYRPKVVSKVFQVFSFL
jgi:hypothetical protein